MKNKHNRFWVRQSTHAEAYELGQPFNDSILKAKSLLGAKREVSREYDATLFASIFFNDWELTWIEPYSNSWNDLLEIKEVFCFDSPPIKCWDQLKRKGAKKMSYGFKWYIPMGKDIIPVLEILDDLARKEGL